jgi:hypothetical protein
MNPRDQCAHLTMYSRGRPTTRPRNEVGADEDSEEEEEEEEEADAEVNGEGTRVAGSDATEVESNRSTPSMTPARVREKMNKETGDEKYPCTYMNNQKHPDAGRMLVRMCKYTDR